MTPEQITALTTELQTDPNGYGYAADIAAGSDQGLVDKLNLRRPSITIRRSDITPQEILEAVDIRDFLATPAGVNNVTWAGSWLESVMQVRSMRLRNQDGTMTRVMQNIQRMLVNASQSEARLSVVAVRQGSRAEELFGEFTRVAAEDVARALGR